MTGKHSGSVARIRDKVPSIIQTHRMIHREVLVVKHLGQSSVEVSLNTIKAHPLRSRTVARKFSIGGLYVSLWGLWVYAGGHDILKIDTNSTDL